MSESKSIVKKLAVVASFGLAATLMSGEHAEAATDQAPLAVSALVVANCLVYTSALSFNSYDPGSATDLDTAAGGGTPGVISVDCTQNVDFSFSFNAGANGGTSTVRAMGGTGAAAGSELDYELRYGASGDLPAGAAVVLDTGDGFEGLGLGGASLQTYSIDGFVAAGQSVAGGTYNDSVTATLLY